MITYFSPAIRARESGLGADALKLKAEGSRRFPSAWTDNPISILFVCALTGCQCGVEL